VSPLDGADARVLTPDQPIITFARTSSHVQASLLPVQKPKFDTKSRRAPVREPSRQLTTPTFASGRGGQTPLALTPETLLPDAQSPSVDFRAHAFSDCSRPHGLGHLR